MPWMWIHMERRTMKYLIVFLSIITLSSCSSKTPKENKVQNNYDYSTPATYQSPSTKTIETESVPSQTSPVPSRNLPSSTIDRYDEGLLDGEAAAEEDRLAGRPGMQIGDEDYDDEYDDGYDDGYDE